MLTIPLRKRHNHLLLVLALAATSPAGAQSLCDDFHVPGAHIGNIQGCVFDANSNTSTITFNAPAILQWNGGFRVAAGQTLRFAFPNATGGAVLNRDLSGARSDIAGSVISNGRVLLINPAGDISVQPGGLIDADGGFLASTLDTADDEALLAGGGAQFNGSAFTAIDNRGTIRSAAGDVTLIAGSVNNFFGAEIIAPSGSVHIGAGTNVQLAQFAPGGDPRIMVLEGEGLVNNLGTISAANSIGIVTTRNQPVPAGQNDPSIENLGRIITTSANGRVFLRAGQGQVFNRPGALIDAMAVSIDGQLTDQGSIIVPDTDTANPGAPSATRQFPSLTTGGLSNAVSDLRLSRLSFSHVNGLESKSSKKPKRVAQNGRKVAATTRGSNAQPGDKKKTTSTGKKVVLRRGAFFGKRTQ